MLLVERPAGELLAYYAAGIGVLAPRGWHCFVLSGSSGESILVTPDAHGAKDLFGTKTGFKGPGIELQSIWGGASGRFDVAQIAGRIFPVAKPFVQQVIDEGLIPKEMFFFTPFPNDALNRRSDTAVEYVTAANSNGLGTHSFLARDDQPISGVAILKPAEDMSLFLLSVRLPPQLRGLSSTILKNVELDRGRLR
jgi:hypothetical protein